MFMFIQCFSRKILTRENVFSGKCGFGKMVHGEMFRGEMKYGEKISGETIIRGNVPNPKNVLKIHAIRGNEVREKWSAGK
jgi:hypothetical protein